MDKHVDYREIWQKLKEKVKEQYFREREVGVFHILAEMNKLDDNNDYKEMRKKLKIKIM
jgi:hypothetical protein